VQPEQPTSLRTFLILWIGQMTSILGSEMTNFAITIWAWQIAGQATPLSLIFFFTYTPKLIAASFAGLLVDRWNRKQLMMGGDTAAGISTIAILLLLLTGRLEIWHFYITAAINGLFGYIQSLAFSASMSAIVPPRHYTRATAMSSYVTYFGSYIMAPALAGVFYYAIGLSGILAIDLVTFVIAVGTTYIVHIPQPRQSEVGHQSTQSIWQALTFGFRYLWKRPSLLAILIFWLSFHLFDGATLAIFPAMVLARSNNDAAVLASVQFAIGIGGLVGATGLSVWGGPKRRIHGLLFGTALMSLGKIIFGLGRVAWHWMTAGFLAAFVSPAIDSSNQAIWLSKVEPDVQGRVFASRYLIAQVTTPLGLAIAGPLADYFFEPAMLPGGSIAGIFGGLFGTGDGAGMALQYSLFSCCSMLIGFGGYAFPVLRDVESLVPDHHS